MEEQAGNMVNYSSYLTMCIVAGIMALVNAVVVFAYVSRERDFGDVIQSSFREGMRLGRETYRETAETAVKDLVSITTRFTRRELRRAEIDDAKESSSD